MTDVQKIAEILGRERKKGSCVHVALPLWIILKPLLIKKPHPR